MSVCVEGVTVVLSHLDSLYPFQPVTPSTWFCPCVDSCKCTRAAAEPQQNRYRNMPLSYFAPLILNLCFIGSLVVAIPVSLKLVITSICTTLHPAQRTRLLQMTKAGKMKCASQQRVNMRG